MDKQKQVGKAGLEYALQTPALMAEHAREQCTMPCGRRHRFGAFGDDDGI